MQAIEHTCRVCEWNLTKAAEVLKNWSYNIMAQT
ncbi:hypothetical protein OH693_24130 [Escherichia coli]|nr:hypothetical protein [Escherichia coli]